MVDTRTDYPEHAVEAARSVMLEMVRLLGEYRDDIVIIGGWVPELLLTESEVRHFGSIDVDIALDHNRVSEAAYRTIRDLLISHGYREGQQPFIFLRTVEVQGKAVTVHVDFLAGEYGGTSQGHRTQSVQDIAARKARGCDLAFEMNQPVKIEGRLPDGGKDSAEVRVASVVPFMVMKGMALSNRLKPKDAWDILFFVEPDVPGLARIIHDVFRRTVFDVWGRSGFVVVGCVCWSAHTTPFPPCDRLSFRGATGRVAHQTPRGRCGRRRGRTIPGAASHWGW